MFREEKDSQTSTMNQTDIPIHLDLSNLDTPGHQSSPRTAGPASKSIDRKPPGENHLLVKFDETLSNGANSDSSSDHDGHRNNRRRSNSRSQVVATPNLSSFGVQGLAANGSVRETNENNNLFNEFSGDSSPIHPKMAVEDPKKRKQVQYFVTLSSLNETFAQKHLSVPYYPDTRKLGRPTGAKIKPDVTNGFFDSRVLSRNHAAMYVDGNSGKLMLKDLGSSNGTFVNDRKLDTEPVEIKVGDDICFGFNIQVGINHKQINAKVENINVMNDILKPSGGSSEFQLSKNMDPAEYKHYQYIQELYNKVKASAEDEKTIDKKSHQRGDASFETALFSDVNPDIEENLLGLYTKANNGIFKNSGTSSTSKLESSINILVNCLTRIKQQNNSLSSLEEFLESYKSKLNDLNDSYLKHQYDTKLSETIELIEQEKSSQEKLKAELKVVKDENYKKTKKLEEKVFKLKDDKQSLNKQITELKTNLKEKEDRLVELESSTKEINLPVSSSKISLVEDSLRSLTSKLDIGDLQDSGLNANITNKGDNGSVKTSELLDFDSNPSSNSDTNSNSDASVDKPESSNLNTTPVDSGWEGGNEGQGGADGRGDEGQEDEGQRGGDEREGQSQGNQGLAGGNESNDNNNSNNNNNNPNNNNHDDDDPSIPFVKVPSTVNDADIDLYDADNDLRYNNGMVAVGLVCIIVGIFIHKFT